MLAISILFTKFCEADTAAPHMHRPLPTLYADIIDHILGIVDGWYTPEREKTLLRCALVSKEWCTLARRYSFTTIRGIATYELHQLRKILHPGCNTLSKHIRTAAFRIYMDSDEWSDVKEMINLMKGSDSRIHTTLREGSLFAWHLWDLSSSISKLTHLELSHIKLLITKDELTQFLRSSPQLRNLSLNSVGWWIEESSLHYAIVGSSGRNTDQRTQIGAKGWKENDLPFTLDRLYFYLETCDEEENPFTERLWPHVLFKNLKVNTLIMRVDSAARAFEWGMAAAMVQSVSSDLVELDLAHEPMDYNCEFLRIICNIPFPKLQSLKLVIGAQSDDYDYDMPLSVGKPIQQALSQMVMPALEKVVIFVTEGLIYLAAIGSVLTHSFDTEYGSMALGYDWDIIDSTIQAIAESTRPQSDDQCGMAAPKFIIASESFFLDNYTEFDVNSIFAYIESSFPKTAASKAQLDFRIASREIETSHFS